MFISARAVSPTSKFRIFTCFILHAKKCSSLFEMIHYWSLCSKWILRFHYFYQRLSHYFQLNYSSIWFGSNGAFWIKKQNHTRKIGKIHGDFWIYQVFIHDYMSQNVSIAPNHILPTRTKSIFTLSANFQHFSTSSIKIGSIPFFLIF